MSKLVSKISIPIILAGIFAVVVFLSVSYEQLNFGAYVVILFLVVYVFLFGLAVGQNLASPIKELLEKATELKNGNLSSRVYLETKDELAELAKIFNKIAEELEARHEQEANIEKSISVKVKARTEDLEEMIDALEQKVKNRTIELERLLAESGRLQAEIKERGGETIKLKKELSGFKQKLEGGQDKPKK